MVLQHLHSTYHVCRQVLAGLGILAPHQVHPLDVEFIDGFPLEGDAPVRPDFQARHLGYHIGNAFILPLLETAHIID